MLKTRMADGFRARELTARACPHANARLTCPDFQTTPESLDIHRRQAETNRKLIARADHNGQFRLAESLRQVQASLERIIPALETITENGQT